MAARPNLRYVAAACALLGALAAFWLLAGRASEDRRPSPEAAETDARTPDTPVQTRRGVVLWNGDFSTGDLSQYPKVAVDPADSADVVDDPILGPARKALKLTVSNTSPDPAQPGSPKHRAHAESPEMIGLTDDVYVGLSVLVPRDFPVIHTPGDVGNGIARQCALHSLYGAPYSGSSPQQIGITGAEPDQALRLLRNGTYGYDNPWSLQTERGSAADMTGRWIDFVIHTRMSTDSSIGFREQWVNTGDGFVKQTFADGTTRLMMQTVDASNAGGPNYSKVQLYFNDDAFVSPENPTGTASVYFADHRIGTSFDAVAPRSYR